MTDTDKYLAEVRERAEKATPGPWVTEPGNHWLRIRYYYKSYDHGTEESAFIGRSDKLNDCAEFNNQDGPFIAHARTDIPQLLKLIAERDAEIARLNVLKRQSHETYLQLFQDWERIRKQVEAARIWFTVPGHACIGAEKCVKCAALAELDRLEKE